MSINRANVVLSILKGLLLAIALTLLGMLVLAALVVFARISDGLLTALNQVLKLAAIALGVRVAVGRGGTRGYFTGAALALIYTILGYAMYVGLGGGAYSTASMLGEMLIGATAGGLVGAILANLRPKRRRAKTARAA